MRIALRSTFWRPTRALVATGGILLLLVVGWLWWNLARPLPSDAGLRRRFHEHRTEFDRLAAMAQADTQLVLAGHDWMLMRFAVYVHGTPRSDHRLTDEEGRATGRLEFRRLLDRVGLPSISRSAEGDAIWFVVLSSSGVRKGIVFSEKPLEPEHSSLDGLARAKYVAPGYVPLAPRWFLFINSSD